MSPHDFPEGGGICKNCGTMSINVNQTACPGPRPGLLQEIRPEPTTRRQPAVDDYDTIGRRLAELAEERTAAMNTEDL